MRQPDFTWFTPTLGLRPPKIVQTKPSGFLFLLGIQQGYKYAVPILQPFNIYLL